MRQSDLDNKVVHEVPKKQNVLSWFSAAVVGLFAMLFMVNSAIAHPGHDHAANEAMLIHVIFYGSIVVVVAACAWFAYRQFNKQKK